MFFTQEDYQKIYKWLQSQSIKDTEFKEAAAPLSGNEIIAFVQNGRNVKTFLKDLVSQLLLLGVPDFLNITAAFKEENISLARAISLIPYKGRKLGIVITFKNTEGLWKLYQYQGENINQWNNVTLWIDIIEQAAQIGTVLPDEEDLTGQKVKDRTIIKFKDKSYIPEEFSGLGRVYLRKNITSVVDPVTGNTCMKNVLTQDMINKEHTIYHIQYDYDLNTKTVTVPDGSVLKFEGGSISNGYINLSNDISLLSGDFHDVIINSSFDNLSIKDCSFTGGTINSSGTTYDKALLTLDGTSNITIDNSSFANGRVGVYFKKVSNIRVTKTVFKNFSSWANYFNSVKGLLFTDCTCTEVEDGIKLTGEIGNVVISNNESYNNRQDGIDFAGHSCYDVLISNNVFHDNEANGITFKSLDRTQFPLSNYGLTEPELKWLNITISNNTCYNNKITGIQSYHLYAGSMGERFRNFVFSNNLVFSNISSSTGLHISGNTTVLHGISIINNDVKGNFTYGVTLSNARYFLFKNNDVYVDGTGLRLDKQNYNGEPVLNDIIDNTITAYRSHALWLYKETTNNNIKNNYLKSAKVAKLSDLGTNNNIYNPTQLDVKTKVASSARPDVLKEEDYLYSILNTDTEKKEYWNGKEWLNGDGTLVSKVTII